MKLRCRHSASLIQAGIQRGIQSQRFYHGFVLGLIVELANQYRITSNRESGLGRYDIMLEPLDKSKIAYVIEFKVFKSKTEKNLEETAQNALDQIVEKNYDAELIAKGVVKDNIRHFGFAFKGKEVLIIQGDKRNYTV